jgi:hypothetical protein
MEKLTMTSDMLTDEAQKDLWVCLAIGMYSEDQVCKEDLNAYIERCKCPTYKNLIDCLCWGEENVDSVNRDILHYKKFGKIPGSK